MNQPLVTIVTPSYNQGQYIEQTIRSVLEQTYPNIEYIILDAGSKDQTIEIIKKYESRLAYWHSRRDEGAADAIHQGFERSKGQILAWLNSDDLLAADAVEKAVAALLKQPELDMVFGNRVCIDQEGQLLYYKPSLPLLFTSPYLSMILPQESCFWRREVYYKAGGMLSAYKFAFDYYLFSKIALSGKVQYVGSIWGFFRKHPESKTVNEYTTVGLKESLEIQQRVWGKPANPLKWKTVSYLQRFYALAATLWVSKPAWPASLPPMKSQNIFRRYYRSLHKDALLKRLVRKLSGNSKN